MSSDNTAPAVHASLPQKYLQVLAPIAAASIGTTLVYSALNWFLVQRDNLIPLDPDIANIWLPLVLSLGLSIAVAARTFKLLAWGAWNAIAAFLLAMAAVVAPVLLAQEYVSNAAGKITHVANTAQISANPRTRFYASDAICFNNDRTAAWPTFHLDETEDSNDLIVTLYVAIAVCGASSAAPETWIGFTYRTTIDNRLPDAAREAEYHKFLNDVDHKFAKVDPSKYRYLERLGFGTERRNFDTALRKSKFDPRQAAIFLPHEDDFVARADGWALTAALSAAGSLIALAILLFFVPFKEKGAEPEPTTEATGLDGDGSSLRGFIIPSRENFGLPLLLDVNLAMYLCMVLAGLGLGTFQSEDLIAWGGNYGPALHGLGWLRLISSQFVHGGFMHLANNMYGLLIVCAYLSPIAALNGRLIGCYLLAGFGASVTSALVHPDIVSVGASGAIFGLCGVLTVLLLLRDPRLSAARGAMLTNMAIYVGLNLAIGAATPGVDNAAHVGGLISGAVIGVILTIWDRTVLLHPRTWR